MGRGDPGTPAAAKRIQKAAAAKKEKAAAKDKGL